MGLGDPVPQVLFRKADNLPAAGSTSGLPQDAVSGGPQGFLLDGLERQLDDRMISMEYEETDVGADEVTIVFENQDLQLYRNPMLIPNIGSFEMFFGWEGRMGPARRFAVVEISGYRELTVRALHEPEWRLSRVARTQRYTKNRISDIVLEVATAKRNNMVPSVQSTPYARTKKSQSNQSDAEFLQTLADEIGFVWFVERWGGRDRLYFLERNFKASAEDPPVEYNVGKDPRILGDPDFRVDVFNIFGLVEADIFDPLQKIHQTVLMDINTLERRVAGKSSPITGESKIRLSTTSQKLLRGEEEMAGVYKEAERGLIKATLPVLGDPFMRPKRQINLSGVPPLLAGTYYVDTISYSIDREEAFTMELAIRKNAFAVTASSIDFALVRLTEIQRSFQQAVEKAKNAEERARLAELTRNILADTPQPQAYVRDRSGPFGLPGR